MADSKNKEVKIKKESSSDKKVIKKNNSEEIPWRWRYDKRNTLNNLTSKEWLPETISVFVQKWLWAWHPDTKIERQHPAPYSYQDVMRLIKFFTKEWQKVLDPFNGIWSTLKACALSWREWYGIELIEKYYKLTLERLKTELKWWLFPKAKQTVIHWDALKEIKKIWDDSFDLLVTSPPYWNILQKVDHKAKWERIKNNLDHKYSEDKNDLWNIDNYEIFLEKLWNFFIDCWRIIKKNWHFCIVVSDFRQKSKLYTFHTDLSNYIEKNSNIVLKWITILYQSRKKIYPYWYPFSYVPNIHHQYILIMKNEK